MPELPEVETIQRGLIMHVKNETIISVNIRKSQLRWPIIKEFSILCAFQQIENITRRGKYLIFYLNTGHIICHLGMSGSLRIVKPGTLLLPHDHVEFILSSQKNLRYHDPRRFGALLWSTEDPLQHPLLETLGLEPLEAEFDGDYLYTQCLKRKVAIKKMLMDNVSSI